MIEITMKSNQLLDTPGKRIKLLREGRGWTQIEFSKILKDVGIQASNSYLSEIERNTDAALNRVPSADVLAKIATVLNTTTDYLLLLSDDPFPPRTNETQLAIEASSPEERAMLEQLFETIKDFRIEDMEYILQMLQFMQRMDRRVGEFAKIVRAKQL